MKPWRLWASLAVALASAVGAGAFLAERRPGPAERNPAPGDLFPYTSVAPGAHVPKLSFHQTIPLEPGSGGIGDIRFSPDGKYLAIAYHMSRSQKGVKVWDIQRNKEQAKLYCAKDDPMCWDLDSDILWANDSRTLSFGRGPRWDALTGSPLTPDPLTARDDWRFRTARLNKDGTKMLSAGRSNGAPVPNEIIVYDTRDWSSKVIDTDGLDLLGSAWTSDDKVIIGARASRNLVGKQIGEYVVKRLEDLTLRLIDPMDGSIIKSVWFSIPPGTEPQREPDVDPELQQSCFAASKIATVVGLIDDRRLEVQRYDANGTNAMTHPQPVLGIGGIACSPDGKYVYLKDPGWFDNRAPITNAIADLSSGKVLTTFGGGKGSFHDGIGVSADGRMLALGNVTEVQVLRVDDP